MEAWHAWLLIALVIGVIVSNMMVFKHISKMKIPPLVQKDRYLPKSQQSANNPDGNADSSDPKTN